MEPTRVSKNKTIASIASVFVIIFGVSILGVIGYIIDSIWGESVELYTVESSSESDCYKGEEYDSDRKVCYYTCDSYLKCNDLSDTFANISRTEPSVNPGFTGVKYATDFATIDEYAVFEIQSKAIDKLLFSEGTSLTKEKASELYSFFNYLTPDIYEHYFTEFTIFSDQTTYVGGFVYLIDPHNDYWGLAVNTAYVYHGEEIDKPTLSLLYIHELAHLISLKDDQLKYNYELIAASATNSLTREQYENLYANEKANCSTFFIDEGCALGKAYINDFYEKYWLTKSLELEDIMKIEDIEARSEAQIDFYTKYEDEFVSEYSSIDPLEDFAETFTYYVVATRLDKIENSYASKVKTLDGYNEVNKARESIRGPLFRLILDLEEN